MKANNKVIMIFLCPFSFEVDMILLIAWHLAWLGLVDLAGLAGLTGLAGLAETTEATGGHGRPREATEDHGRPREATGGDRCQFPRTDFAAFRKSSRLPTSPGPLKLCLFG